jgi:hypothetical protein
MARYKITYQKQSDGKTAQMIVNIGYSKMGANEFRTSFINDFDEQHRVKNILFRANLPDVKIIDSIDNVNGLEIGIPEVDIN